MKQKKKTSKEKWGKKQVFFIDADPYRQDIIVVVNGEFRDAYNKIKKQPTPNAKIVIEHIDSNKDEYFEKPLISTEGTTYHALPFGYVVVVKHLSSWLDTVGLVHHECLHLASYILRKVGIEHCHKTEEAYTYLQQRLAKEILDKMY